MPEVSPRNREDRAAETREIALRLFESALVEGGIDKAFQRNVGCERGVLRICEDLYDLTSYNRVFVVTTGKAAHSMLQAFMHQAGERFEGIVAGPAPTSHQLRGFQYFTSGHPLPNDESIAAAHAILKSVRALDAASLVIFLVSGGTSAMVEAPIDNEFTLADVVATYQALIHCGAPIGEMNAVRKHLSIVKGGRLASAAYPAQQVSLLVSDVPDSTPDALASGPTMPDASSVEDCYAVVSKHNLAEKFPRLVREWFQRRALDETPKSGDPEFSRSRWWTILSNAVLLEHVREQAGQLGFHAEIDNTCDDWDYLRAREYLLGRLRDLRKKFERVCLISGGEVTVKVSKAGIGGRNQQFVLSCATEIVGENVTIFSAGTDGIDGNSPAAGAIVDGGTLKRAELLGLNAHDYLNNYDAHTFFDRIGDAITIGPTGNNLRDLRILLAY